MILSLIHSSFVEVEHSQKAQESSVKPKDKIYGMQGRQKKT